MRAAAHAPGSSGSRNTGAPTPSGGSAARSSLRCASRSAVRTIRSTVDGVRSSAARLPANVSVSRSRSRSTFKVARLARRSISASAVSHSAWRPSILRSTWAEITSPARYPGLPGQKVQLILE